MPLALAPKASVSTIPPLRLYFIRDGYTYTIKIVSLTQGVSRTAHNIRKPFGLCLSRWIADHTEQW